MDKQSYNRREFDENFRRLLNLSEKIINRKDELSQDLDLENKGNPILKCLHQYMRCYSKTSPEEVEEFHVDLFREIFDRYKFDIIENGHENTNWIMDYNIVIIYGSNMGLGNKSRIRIYISHLYEMATIMKTETERELRGKSEDDYSKAEELNYPDAYLLYIYRIFKTFQTDSKISARLTIIISDLEEKLGVTERAKPSVSQGNGLDGLLEFATGMMGQMGLPQAPEGSAPPSGDDVGKALQNVFGNPKTQDAISGMFKDLDQSNDIGDVIGKLVNGMSNPQFKDAIGESLNGMADASGVGGAANGAGAGSSDSQKAIEGSSSNTESQTSGTNSQVVDEEIPIVTDD